MTSGHLLSEQSLDPTIHRTIVEKTVCTTDVSSESKGSIQWVIKHWSVLSTLEAGGFTSSALVCAGHEWTLKVFNTKYGPHVFLSYSGHQSSVGAKFSLRLVNQLPGKEHMMAPTDIGKFSLRQQVGHHFRVAASTLADESNGFKLNDSVIIEAYIAVYGQLRSTVHKDMPCKLPCCVPVFAVQSLSVIKKADLAHVFTSGSDFDLCDSDE